MFRELTLWLMLSAAAYRLTRLITKDTFPPVLWLRDRLAGGWRNMTDAEWHERRKPGGPDWPMNDQKQRYVYRAKWSPDWLAELITCPWCASAYVSACVVGVTDIITGLAWPWLMTLAVWAVAALVASKEWA